MYQQITVENSEVTFSVFKALVGNEEYIVRIEQPSGDFGTSSIVDLRLSLSQLRKLANAMRNYTYPRVSDERVKDERVKVCLNATVSKSALENTQFAEKTSTATMALFLKSLRVEDVAYVGTSSDSANSSHATAN